MRDAGCNNKGKDLTKTVENPLLEKMNYNWLVDGVK